MHYRSTPSGISNATIGLFFFFLFGYSGIYYRSINYSGISNATLGQKKKNLFGYSAILKHHYRSIPYSGIYKMLL